MRTKKEGIVVVLFAVFFLSSITFAVDCPVPDTGQTKCYDNSQEITCPALGEPFYGQDAQYNCNPQSYTKLDANGNDLPDEATEWVMVRDNVTGLIWEVKTDDGSIHDRDDYYWQNAQDVFIAALNTPPGFGGFTDWRMPTVKELSFIVHSDITTGSTIDQSYFPDSVSSGYWSSTTYASGTGNAWYVDFYNGSVRNRKSYDYYVRAVRAGQSGLFDNFIDNGDGTVTNLATGLMWQQATALGTYTWEEALTYCEGLSLAVHDDWRLPNRNELQSIVDYSTSPAIDTVYFPDTVSSDYWSSTTYAFNTVYAGCVYFYNAASCTPTISRITATLGLFAVDSVGHLILRPQLQSHQQLP